MILVKIIQLIKSGRSLVHIEVKRYVYTVLVVKI